MIYHLLSLKSGKILIISDEVVCKYNCIEEFMGDEGEYNYERYCVDLIDPDLPEKQPQKEKPIGRSFVFNGVEITNPNMSECGRFSVNPETYYGHHYLMSLQPLEDKNEDA